MALVQPTANCLGCAGPLVSRAFAGGKRFEGSEVSQKERVSGTQPAVVAKMQSILRLAASG